MYVHILIHIYSYIALMTCYDILHSLTNYPVDFKILTCPKCIHTQNVALLKSLVNILLYQTLQNTNKRRNRKFDIFLFIASQVIRNFVAVRKISVVEGTVPVAGCLNM